MDRQAAYDLFASWLTQRRVEGIDVKKDLQGLLAYGVEQGCFINPHAVHELSEWRKFGDRLWELTLNDDKTAKKLGKLWRMVHNELLRYQAEKRAAQSAVAAKEKNTRYGEEETRWPLPPTFRELVLPPLRSEETGQESSERVLPTAPPASALSSPDASSQTVTPEGENSTPGSEDGLGIEIAKERCRAWNALAREGLEKGDEAMTQMATAMAFPVQFQPNPAGGINATVTALDWKLLSQLRSTVSSYGVTGEPVRQMLDYLWSTQLLLPADCRGIAKLIFSPSQWLLFNAHWQARVLESVAIQRQAGDPLQGITMDELMGLGPYARVEAQALLGPDKVREAMRLVREAIEQVKEPGGVPMYMGIKQGREETLGSFVDKLVNAIERARVPLYMQGALLKQCISQNGNPATKSLLNTLRAHWTVEEALEKASSIPTGPQAFLVEAIKKLGEGMKEQAQATQSQVMAALAPLQTSATVTVQTPQKGQLRCYRCGAPGHVRKSCTARNVWCQTCRSNSHNEGACRRRSGNSTRSAFAGRRATTKIAAAAQSFNPPPGEVSGWTWQQQ